MNVKPRAASVGALRQTLSIASGTALGQVALVLVTPLLTRLYSPQDFGLFALFSAVLAVASVGVTLRYDMAIPAARSDGAADRLLLVSLLALVPTTLVTLLAFVALRTVDSWGFAALPVWSAAVLAPALAATGAFTALRFWTVRQADFDAIGAAVLRQGLGRAIAPLGMALLHGGWLGLAIGDLIGRAFGLASLWRRAAARLHAQWRRPARLRLLLAEAHRHRRFPGILLPSSLIDALAGSIALPLIAATHGVAAAGEFALLTRIASAPGALLGAAIADVFHGRAVQLLHEAPERAQAAFVGTLGRLAAGAAAVYVPAALVAVPAFGLILGDQWAGAGVAFVILAPFFATALVVSPLSRLVAVTGHLHYKLAIDVLLLIGPPLALWTFRDRGFHEALVAYTIANVACYGVYLALIWKGLRSAVRVRGVA